MFRTVLTCRQYHLQAQKFHRKKIIKENENKIEYKIEWISNLTHWGRVTHICVGKLTNIGSDNGLSPGRRQSIIWTNAGIPLIGPLGTNSLSEFLESQVWVNLSIYLSSRVSISMPRFIAGPIGRDIGYLLWIQIVIYIIPQSHMYCMKHRVILDHVIRTLDCLPKM